MKFIHRCVLLTWITVHMLLQTATASPCLEITFPSTNCGFCNYFSWGFPVRIHVQISKAATQDVSEVRYYESATNLIGSALSEPYSIYYNPRPQQPSVNAVVVFVDGTTCTSTAVSFFMGQQPPFIWYECKLAEDHTVFARQESVTLAYEMLTGYQSTNELLVDGVLSQTITNFVGTLLLTNLTMGKHVAAFRNEYGEVPNLLPYGRATFEVVDLGLDSAKLLSPGQVQLTVVTSLLGQPVVLERSFDLTHWTPVSTNIPTGFRYDVVDTSVTNAAVFYRAVSPQ